MANTQLIAYVTAQLDKGVAREAITQALIGAGWLPADVESAVTEVVQQRGAAGVSAVAATQPATSYSPAATTATTTTTTTTSPVSSVTPASFFATTSAASSYDATATAAATQPKRSLTWLFILVGIILALGIIGGLVYAFMGGSSAAPTADSTGADQALITTQQERDQLRAEVATLSDNVTAMTNELSIFQATTTVAVPLTIKGTLTTTTANAWILTTDHGIVLTVSNAKDAAVAAALTPLKGAVVELTGTHASGSTLLKVTAVNGSAITTAVPAATTSTTKVGTSTKQ
jgi:hypothetical protein